MDIMPKALIQQRLLTCIVSRGPKKHTLELRMPDICQFTGVSRRTLDDCAHRRREVDDPLQRQLSTFFNLWESGLLVKVKEGDEYLIKRVLPPPGYVEPPKARVSLSWGDPLIKWSR
jgi:predicted DNA-binding transcriptional regulator AlpA